MPQIDLVTLKKAVAGGAPAIRARTRLEPAGGPGDKVFPPTYVKSGRAETKYAFEERQIAGKLVATVLLDSVQSQANRMEEALLEGWRRKELKFPVVQVDFTKQEGLEDLGELTALQAPHRIADALLRDSTLDKKSFRESKPGKEFTEARASNATGVYKYCPTALVFGVWDSTGPKGGLGAKFQRALVSEIVGIDVKAGVKTSSRIDPAGIEKHAGTIFKKKGTVDDWTTDEKLAEVEGKKSLQFGRTKGEKGSPAAINHGNIPPTIDEVAGGVTLDHAIQTTVLSLAALRRLKFADSCGGEAIPGEKRAEAEIAARTALAALALAAIVCQRDNDYDLRSRSLLIAKEPLTLELLSRDGSEPQRFTLDPAGAAKLLEDAEKDARKVSMGWDPEPITLTPKPELCELIRKSRELKKAGEDAEEGP